MGRLAQSGPLRAVEDYVSGNCPGWAFKAKFRAFEKPALGGFYGLHGKAGFMLRTPRGFLPEWAYPAYCAKNEACSRLEGMLRLDGWHVGSSYGETMIKLYAAGPGSVIGFLEKLAASRTALRMGLNGGKEPTSA